MRRHRERAGRQAGRFTPKVEALEERCVLAANFMVRNGTLLITAPTTPTPTNDTIIISDNGGNGPNSVVAWDRAPFFPNVPIKQVVVVARAGNDRVLYNLTGDLTTSRTVTAFLGRGDDTFSATLRRNIQSTGSLNLNAYGGGGNDRLMATLIGSLFGNAKLNINYNGGRGNNILNIISATYVNVDAGSTLTENLAGNGQSDHVFADYVGVMNGNYSINESAGRRDSNLFADVELAPGSTGTVGPSELRGGPGNDNLTFVVHNPGTASANDNTLDGGGGLNSDTRTTNVVSFNCANDTIVP
jgi:hypothetical protein